MTDISNKEKTRRLIKALDKTKEIEHSTTLTKKELIYKCNSMIGRQKKMLDTMMKLRLELDYLKRGDQNTYLRMYRRENDNLKSEVHRLEIENGRLKRRNDDLQLTIIEYESKFEKVKINEPVIYPIRYIQ